MKIISCFSYKGGAGRSTLAMNVIPFLAEELGASAKHPLIVADMDIDSCGITYLFNLAENVDRDCNVQSLFGIYGIQFNADAATPIESHPLFSNLPRIGRFFGLEDDGAILCLPAMPGERLNGVSGSNYDSDDTNYTNFLEICRSVGCCAVLLDSAVGNQLTANWSNEQATHIMCCLRPTKQFREGTKRFFDEFDNQVVEKNVIVIPNVVPTDPLYLSEGGEPRNYPDYAKEQILSSFEDNAAADENHYILDMVNGDVFGIPKIDRFMWQEDVLNNVDKATLTDLERVALRQYKKIASLIKNS